MRALFAVGMMGLLGSCGALECETIGMLQFAMQAVPCGAVALFGFFHSDLVA